jgi:hypothetical protein
MTNSTDPSDELGPIARFRSPLRAVVGGLVLVIAAVTLWSTQDGWRYYLRANKAVDVGTAQEGLAKGKLRHNTYVRMSGRPLLSSVGNAKITDSNPGCLSGPTRNIHYTLLAETGDRVVVRTLRRLQDQGIAERTSFTGRLLRIDTSAPPHRLYRRFVYKLTNCAAHPKTCDKFLRVSADISTKTLMAGVGKGKTVLRGVKGESIAVTRMTRLYLAFRFRGDYEYTLRSIKKPEAMELVKKLGVPYRWVDSSRGDQEFILRPPKAVADQLIGAQRRGSGYSISARTAGFHVRYGWLERDGGFLKITKSTQGFPEQYRVQPSTGADEPAQLVPAIRSGSIRVRIDQVTKAAYHGPRRIPKHAWLLVEDVKPNQAVAAALIALGLVLLGLGGLLLMGLGLRRPR